jgi:hypothetical protein
MKKNPPTAPELDGSCAADDSAKTDGPTPLTARTASIKEFIQQDLELEPPINDATQATFATLKQELEDYLADEWLPLMNGGEHNDTIQWWKNNHAKYKHIAAIAKEYLAIQASSASSERILTKANRLIDERIARLSSQIVTKILFLMAHLDCFKDV